MRSKLSRRSVALLVALSMIVAGCTEADTTPAPNDAGGEPDTTPAPNDAGAEPDTTPAPNDAGGEPDLVESLPYGLADELEYDLCTQNEPGFLIDLAAAPRTCSNWAVLEPHLALKGDDLPLAVGTYDLAEAAVHAIFRPDPHTLIRGESGSFEIVEILPTTLRVRWEIVLTDGRRTAGDIWVELCTDPDATTSAKCI